MGSLLVRAAFGERVAEILVWQRGKRSSENGVQTTLDLGGCRLRFAMYHEDFMNLQIF